MNFDVPGYETLAKILHRAYTQAATGKGAERHANEQPFSEQPMQSIADKHGVGFLFGQADKKMTEAHNMMRRGETDKAVHELLGAINYIAGAILFAEKVKPAEPTEPAKPTSPFKVGDKVRIAEQIDKSKYELRPGWAGEMDETLGKLGTVSNIDDANTTTCVRVEGGTPYDTWWYLNEDLSAVDEPGAEAEAEAECDCPACTLRKVLGVAEVGILVSSDEDGPTLLADLMGELAKRVKPQK